jgi:membrane-associated phospholipid phosphatase
VDALFGAYLGTLLVSLALTPLPVDGAMYWAVFDTGALLSLATIVLLSPPDPLARAALLRLGFAVGVLPIAYRQVGLTVVALGRSDMGPVLAALDRDLCLGANPLEALETLSSPVLNDAMYLVYVSHWVFPVVVLVALARRTPDAVPRALFLGLASLLLCYAGYALVPAACPDAHAIIGAGAGVADGSLPYRFSGELAGVWVADSVRVAILDFDHTPFTCFPSAHVALTIVCTALAWRLGVAGRRFIAAWAAGIVFSTVYVRRHYVVDVVGGAGVAGVVWLAVVRLHRPLETWLLRRTRHRRAQ